VAGVSDRSRPLELAGRSQLREQQLVQALPDTSALPLIEAAVTGRAAAETELERQMPPGDPGVQHKQDPLQRLPIRQTLTTGVAKPPLHLRQ